MFEHLNVVAATVFVFFFALVTVLGFLAFNWKRASLDSIGEWGLGGRNFGPWVTWFLLGGDLYTAYTVIAVPALVFGVGALGFFAVPYTIIIYPFLYLTMPRLWAVTHKHGYMTAADFILGRYGNWALELAVALTGIVATMPYIALQLVGLEKVIAALGFSGEGVYHHAPITLAFLILALYTYKSGLRAPALIAFVKDAMIYVFIIAAIVVIPYQLGGWAKIFAVAADTYAAKVAAGKVPAAGLTLAPSQIGPYITLAIGSAMALFMYPHALTGTLAASSGRAIRFNTMTLPAYSFVLGLIALLGMMAIAAGVKVARRRMPCRSSCFLGVPGLVRRLLFRRDRARRAGAGGGDVDRRGQHLHPQRLEAVHPPRDDAGRGIRGRQAGVAGRQGRRAAGDLLHADAIRARSAIARRRVDGADFPRAGVRPVHALVQRLGAVRGLGGRHPRRHVAVVDGESLGSRAQTRLGHAVRRPGRPGLCRLQRPDGGGAQHRCGDAAVAGAALEGAGCDEAGGLRGLTAAGMKAGLPNGGAARVDIGKLCDYCLSAEHPRGRHKARLFRAALGMGRDDASELRGCLLAAAAAEPATACTPTAGGDTGGLTHPLRDRNAGLW